MRRRLLIIPVVVLVLAVALVGGVVLAEGIADGDGSRGDINDGNSKGFAARVAEILGLEEDTVADAMEQARQEMHDERVKAWLDKMVESGKITQEQADDYQEWLDDRPDGLDRSWGKGFGGHHGFHSRGRWGKGFWNKDSPDSSESSTESTST